MSYFDQLRALADARRAQTGPDGTPRGAATPPAEKPKCARMTYPDCDQPKEHGGRAVQLGCLPDPEGFCCYCGNKMPARKV